MCLLITFECVCLTTLARAQEVPVPAIQGAVSPVLVTDTTVAPVTPDEYPLSGGQMIGLGSWGAKHSFFTPSLRLAESFDSNPLLYTTSSGGYRALTDFGANVQWMQYLGRDAEIRYSGALRYNTLAELQGYDQLSNAHDVTFFKRIPFRTCSFLIHDEAQYSKGSSFGASGMEGMGPLFTQSSQVGSLSNSQSASNSLRQDVSLDQSILTGQVGRVQNTALIEIDAHLDARDTATLSATYGFLHFNSDLLTDIAQEALIAGFNRTLTPRDSIALEGAYSHFHYQQSETARSTEYFSVLYARRIAGRSSVQVGGGPQLTQSHVQELDDQSLGWQAHATLQYRTRRISMRAQAMRGISGGAGVLNGSRQSIGQGSADLVISRYWSASLTAGISQNQSLNTQQRYRTQFTGLALDRRIGRYTNFFLSYDLQHQNTGSVCSGPACSYNGLRNVFGIGFAWTYRPIGIE
jgi:hypothetical protein